MLPIYIGNLMLRIILLMGVWRTKKKMLNGWPISFWGLINKASIALR